MLLMKTFFKIITILFVCTLEIYNLWIFSGFTSLIRNFEGNGNQRSRQRYGGESVRQSQRASVRQSEGNYHYRDISLRKFNNFMQIILSPSTTKMKNALNSRVRKLVNKTCQIIIFNWTFIIYVGYRVHNIIVIIIYCCYSFNCFS